MTPRTLLPLLGTWVVSSALAAVGCGDTVTSSGTATATGTSTSSSSSSGTGGAGGQRPIEKVTSIDLVLMIDNSRAMQQKQAILANSIPDLVQSLVNPKCIDANGSPQPTPPKGPLEACETGFHRVHQPAIDIHIGVITSSLGGHGSDACSPQTQGPTADDHGHLIDRSDVNGGPLVPTWVGKHFLAWDPAQLDMPPGEKNIGDTMGSPGLVPSLRDLVLGTGEVGCGYESQLESWYRFLVDPEPYQSISIVAGKATPQGVDSTLLAERGDFLRPDSLLAILMLTDENDCSTKEYSQFYLVNQLVVPGNPGKHYHLPRAREECDADPANMCCASCGQNAPAGCPTSQRCMTNPTFDDQDDNPNLRCWDNRRRFGIDFLYPLDRYIQGLTSVTVADHKGELVPNPIFSDLNPTDTHSAIRDQSVVLLAGIVGVPWEDLAVDPKDLTKGFKTSAELDQKLNGGDKSAWDILVGDPSNFVLPTNPLMIESVAPRVGTDPITGAATAPAGTMTPASNPINGKEFDIPLADNLQYACIFDLPMAIDCSDPAATSCDCSPPPGGGAPSDSPVCSGPSGTTQGKGRAYPGLRELAVIRGLGAQGVPTSICPKQVANPNGFDYGYRPALGAVANAIAAHLN